MRSKGAWRVKRYKRRVTSHDHVLDNRRMLRHSLAPSLKEKLGVVIRMIQRRETFYYAQNGSYPLNFDLSCLIILAI